MKTEAEQLRYRADRALIANDPIELSKCATEAACKRFDQETLTDMVIYLTIMKERTV